MATGTLISVREYLATSYRPDREYVDGELIERNVGELHHARLQGLLARVIGNREVEWGIWVLTELRIRVSPDRYRIPDVCAFRRSQAFQAIPDRPPLFCIEILSPDDRVSAVQERVDDFLAMGVPHIWMIDPRRQRAYRCTGDGTFEIKDAILRTDDSAFEIDLGEFWPLMIG